MGKKLLQQRAGRGNINFRSPGWTRVAPARFPSVIKGKTGRVVDILHNPGQVAPIAKIVTDQGEEFYVPAVQGLSVGQTVSIGSGSQPTTGNIVVVGEAPEGAIVSNVEKRRGDGGKFARSAGSYAVVVGRAGNKVLIRLPSGKIAQVNSDALAIIGTVAGGGVTEKPLLKAGNAYWKWKKKARKWPRVRGVAMNAVSHPHGGGAHQSVSRSSTVSRNAPPGRKVGHIAARRTGRKEGSET
ncbi:MAG: 50S ribosomal protein L2 [Thermoprotei archaeon]